MSSLKLSIKLFNNSNKTLIDKSDNLYIQDMKKQELFINNMYNLSNNLNIFFCINRQITSRERTIRNIIKIKLNMNTECEIMKLIAEYSQFNNFNIYKYSKPNNEKMLDIFLRKCHNDNLLNYRNNKIINILYKKNEILNKNNFNNLIIRTHIEFDEKNNFFNNYEQYIEYILYWLDLYSYKSKHFYMMKHSCI